MNNGAKTTSQANSQKNSGIDPKESPNRGNSAIGERPAIAVVGASALFPGSDTSAGFWSDILAGTDLLTEVPPSHWLVDDYFDDDMTAKDKTYGRRGGFLGDVGLDSLGFGIPPNLLASTDTAQLLALIVAQRVLEDATRGQFDDLDRSRCSVILGVTSGQELLGAMASRMNRPMWLQGMRRAGVPEDEAQAACEQIADLHPQWTESTFPGLLGNVVAGRIANRLDLGGTNCVTDAACASSFSAISMGLNELYLGDSDMVIAGGVDTMNDIFMYMCFSKTPALSPTEDIRPFSDKADGTMLGEGLGMVALKRLEDAERDGNDIYCVINGVGSSSDGRSKSVYAPVSAGQARALDRAYEKAGFGPETVELVEAHGTGTVAGDAAEFGGLEIAFEKSGRKDRQWCSLGTVKSQIGHTKAAAGSAGLFKVIMALHHKVLPQTAKIDQPNPKLDLEASPFHLNTRTRPWVRGSDHERRGSVSSFGFGGSNFHVALSEYTGGSEDGPGVSAPRLRTAAVELVVLTAKDGTELVALAQDHIAAATEPGYLTWLAQRSQRSYNSDAQLRLALVASDESDLIEKLGQALERIEVDSAKPFSTPGGIHYGVGQRDGEVAFVFPGQGSQYLFMGADLASQYNEAMRPWDVAADLDWHAEPLQDVVFPITSFEEGGEAAQQSLLTATQWAQPAIGATSLSMLRILRSLGVNPSNVGGHSFGEITALHAAGVLTETDMLRVARRRGELMAEAAQTPGSMTAVARTVEEVRDLVAASGVDVVVANHNSPTQVVLSGATSAIEDIEAKLADQGITAKRLPVATAFHSPVVSGASSAFAEFLDTVDFSTPTMPVHANETAEPYSNDVAEMRVQLGRQLANPVRFVEMIEAMYADGARVFIEVGPSSILTGLVGKILKGRDHTAIQLDKKPGKAGNKKAGLVAFINGLGRMVASGIPMDLDPLWTEYAEFENPHEIDKPKLVIPINGANYGKPYPPKDLTELANPNPERVAPVAAPAETSASPAATPATEHDHTVANAASVVSQPAATSQPAAVTSGVLAAYQLVQQQTAEAHAAYLNAMAQTHTSFLETAQHGFSAIGQIGGVAGMAPAGAPIAAPMATSASVPPVSPVTITPVGAPSVAPVNVVPAVDVVPVAPPPPIAPAPPAVAPVSIPATAVVDRDGLMSLLLGVVSDKTGYPADMLNMEMELEADLGIDSIKRVEILSAMQDAVPELPEVDTSVMAELVTLGQIVDYMNGEIASTAGSADASPGSPAANGAAQNGAAPNGAASNGAAVVDRDGLMSLLLGVVSDKTGYPADMLNMEMELEADLGIDSIKRVEILSAMQDAVPELPEVDASVMAELVTLGQIVDYMNGEIAVGKSEADTALSAVSASQTSDKNNDGSLARYVLQAVPSVPSGERMAGLDHGLIAVSDDGRGVGLALVGLLAEAGVAAQLVDRIAEKAGSGGTNNSNGRAKSNGTSSNGTTYTDGAYAGAIFLGGLSQLGSVEDAIAVNREAFAAAKAVSGSVTAGGVFVTVGDNGGDFGCTRSDAMGAWSAGLTGLARTASIEWPSTTVKALDVECSGRDAALVAADIAGELLNGGPELEVGISAGGTRIVLRSMSVPVESGPTKLGVDDVIVVSGGARGVTAATIIELAKETGASFALLGRSELVPEPKAANGIEGDAGLKRALLDVAMASGNKVSPAELGRNVSQIMANREIRATLTAVEQVGGKAQYLAVDITDSAVVSVALGEVRSTLGPITGVIHGAGVLADKLIAEKTQDQFDRVFDTKVEGLRVILSATAEDEIGLLCLFSSVAARTGNNGQADYAMANEVLNKVAVSERQRRGPSVVVKSMGWGPWAGGMVSPALKSHFEAMGVSLIPLGQGARMLVQELSSPQGNEVELVLGGGVLSSEFDMAEAAVSAAPITHGANA